MAAAAYARLLQRHLRRIPAVTQTAKITAGRNVRAAAPQLRGEQPLRRSLAAHAIVARAAGEADPIWAEPRASAADERRQRAIPAHARPPQCPYGYANAEDCQVIMDVHGECCHVCWFAKAVGLVTTSRSDDEEEDHPLSPNLKEEPRALRSDPKTT